MAFFNIFQKSFKNYKRKIYVNLIFTKILQQNPEIFEVP